VAEFLLDTDAASRLMRAERSAITNMRQSGAKTVSISSVTMAELVYGARLRRTIRPSCRPCAPSLLVY
jgi:predicted nucleic acid-binding protein